MLVISTPLTPAPTTPPPAIGLISTWKSLQAHYHSLGLIRASSPRAFYKPERMEKFSREERGTEKEISYRACHPGSQVLKVQISCREEVIKGEKREAIRKVGQGMTERKLGTVRRVEVCEGSWQREETFYSYLCMMFHPPQGPSATKASSSRVQLWSDNGAFG